MIRKVPFVREGGKTIYRIRCKCGATGDVVNNAPGAGHKPFETLKRNFAAMGWWLAIKPSKDRCPNCYAVRDLPDGGYAFIEGRRESALNGRDHCTNLSEVLQSPDTGVWVESHYKIELEDGMGDGVSKVGAEPPREMKRSDRQVIFAKLQDVYPKEDVGYSEGWSDEKVAKDLGVPRAWVSEIREQNFGPVIDEAERLRRAEADALKRFQAEALRRFKQVQVLASNARGAITQLDQGLEHLRAHLTGEKPKEVK